MGGISGGINHNKGRIMGRKRKDAFIDALVRQHNEAVKEFHRNRKIGAPSIYPVTGKDIDDFRAGKCRYSPKTAVYNTIKSVAEESEADNLVLKERIEAGARSWEETKRLIRENTVLALLFADGKSWPMQVCLWVVTEKIHHFNPDSSRGISLEAAIKMFFDEFKIELEFTRPEATHGSLKQAIKRLKIDELTGYFSKIKSLHKLSPSPYTQGLKDYISEYYTSF